MQRAHQLGVAHAVRFLGAVKRPDYVDLCARWDLMALPSRNEPFGIVVLEAWAAGKPVVATTAGGPREFVWHEVNGFLVDANPGGLAHGLALCSPITSTAAGSVTTGESRWRPSTTGTRWQRIPKGCIRRP